MDKKDIDHIESIDCEFCKRVKLEKFCNKIINKERRKRGEAPILHELAVAFVSHTWLKGTSKSGAGRLVDYRHMGLGYKLNYCPECGRYLRSGRKSNE